MAYRDIDLCSGRGGERFETIKATNRFKSNDSELLLNIFERHRTIFRIQSDSNETMLTEHVKII